MTSHTLLWLAALCPVAAQAATLRPGFDAAEYRELLCIASHMDSMRVEAHYLAPRPDQATQLYSAPEVGFDNHWELWRTANGTLAIMLRATVSTTTSWLANFNCGMVRAQGTCHVGQDKPYDFCADSTALVHAGWTAGLLTMTDDILAKLDSCHSAGHSDFLIAGHSQGGGLSFLLTALLRRMQDKGRLPNDLRFKTYCSAAPKPGDYLFALHYEAMTAGGWSFNVVSADDWVPEVPLSVQRPCDFRPTNPFARMDTYMAGMKGVDKAKVKFLFNRLTKPTQKSVTNIKRYLGSVMGGMLESQRVWFSHPVYEDCANYARAGQTVVLMPDEAYHAVHPVVAPDAFDHHQYNAYYLLATTVLP